MARKRCRPLAVLTSIRTTYCVASWHHSAAMVVRTSPFRARTERDMYLQVPPSHLPQLHGRGCRRGALPPGRLGRRIMHVPGGTRSSRPGCWGER